MDIRHLLRKCVSRLAKIAPSALHQNILKQYLLYDRDLALRHGMLCITQNYSSPVTVASEIETGRLGMKRELPGVGIDYLQITALAEQLSQQSKDFPWKNPSSDSPSVPWGEMFPTLDSLVLHSMIRHFKPKSYIEVGCGFSSRVSSKAAELNRAEGVDTQVTYIEPYPGERLENADLRGQMIHKKIQEVPTDLFRQLEAGDILFIDTSHVIKCQSDVEWELLHILPLLQKGVIVHIHDIYTPYEQPPEWLDNSYAPGMYNEQYALEALLSGGTRFKCIFPLHALCREMPGDVKRWFGTAPDCSRSFWIMAN